jgi:hypothetical protein
MAAPAKPTRPVKRYDVDGNQLKTGHTIGSRAQHIPPQGDDRVQALRAYQAEQETLADHDKDLTAAFREAEDALTGGRQSILAEAESGLDAAILKSHAAAADRLADAKLSPAQLQAKATATALADVLTERGIVPEPPRPMVDTDESDESEEPDFVEQYEDGFYTDDAGALWQVEGGKWSPAEMADEEEEEPPEDQWPNYVANNEQFADLTDSEDAEADVDNETETDEEAS